MILAAGLHSGFVREARLVCESRVPETNQVLGSIVSTCREEGDRCHPTLCGLTIARFELPLILV
jgi:hypothetical protein